MPSTVLSLMFSVSMRPAISQAVSRSASYAVKVPSKASRGVFMLARLYPLLLLRELTLSALLLERNSVADRASTSNLVLYLTASASAVFYDLTSTVSGVCFL